MKNKFSLILISGVLLRLLLAAVTYHSDLQHFYLAGQVIGEGHVLDFYDASKIVFNYPPLVYLFLGPLFFVLSLPFGLELGPSIMGKLEVNLMLLALKLPYLIFDISAGILLSRLFKDQKQKLLTLGLWMFNPFGLYATYMMGQFDIIPTFLVISVLYLLGKKKDLAGQSLIPEAILLGLGASFKIFPFLLLFPLALLKPRMVDKAKIIFFGLGTYLLTIIPFLSSPGFRTTALVASQTTKSLYPKLDISGGEAIYVFPLFVLFFYLLFLFRKSSLKNIWQRFFIVLILFFIFTHYHPQWFLWLTPFLIIDLVKSDLKHTPLVVLSIVSWLGLLTFFDPGLTVWLFSPIFPNFYNLPGIWDLLGINIDINMARSLLQTIFAAVGGYYIYYYFPRKPQT